MKYFLCAFALSFSVASAAVPANLTNQTYNGSTISAGSYFNTTGSQTTFSNSAGTGITLPKGDNITGLEVDNTGILTRNGGSILIQAPGQVVNLNGNIDVRGLSGRPIPGGTVSASDYYGNGGNVTVNAAYLFQNGNIYADGQNGGLVQFNVGGLTMGSTSRISATGRNWYYYAADNSSDLQTLSGTGGTVSVNSTGQVTIPKGAYISTLGNDIEIVGTSVNMDGVLNAQSIKLNANQGDLSIGKDAYLQIGGGTITASASGNLNQDGNLLADGQSSFVAPGNNTSAGSSGNPGGTISLTAGSTFENSGRIQSDGSTAEGGNPDVVPVQPGFSAGNGGIITVSAPSIQNTGVIRANGGTPTLESGVGPTVLGNGGNGGTVNFIGANPTGNGVVVTQAGIGSTNGTLGTINAPDPVSSSNTLIGVWQKN